MDEATEETKEDDDREKGDEDGVIEDDENSARLAPSFADKVGSLMPSSIKAVLIKKLNEE